MGFTAVDVRKHDYWLGPACVIEAVRWWTAGGALVREAEQRDVAGNRLAVERDDVDGLVNLVALADLLSELGSAVAPRRDHRC